MQQNITNAKTKSLASVPGTLPVLFSLTLTSILFSSREASAFRTASNSPELTDAGRVAWAAAVVPFALNDEAPARILPSDAGEEIRKAFYAWSSIDCSTVGLNLTTVTASHAAPNDRQNTIEWLRTGWHDHGFPDNAAGATDVGYAKSAGTVRRAGPR